MECMLCAQLGKYAKLQALHSRVKTYRSWVGVLSKTGVVYAFINNSSPNSVSSGFSLAAKELGLQYLEPIWYA